MHILDGENLHIEDFVPFAVNDEPLPAKEEKEQKQIYQNIQTFDKDKLLEEIDQSYGKMIFNNYNLIKDIEQKQDKILQLINDLKNLLNNTIL